MRKRVHSVSRMSGTSAVLRAAPYAWEERWTQPTNECSLCLDAAVRLCVVGLVTVRGYGTFEGGRGRRRNV